MSRLSRTNARQRGAALILFATVLILGVAWYTVGALGKAPVAKAEREVITGLALQRAKQAMLAYVAQYAARFDTADPGQMPCPESLTLANLGESSTSCSSSAIVIGRLPWKTLGIDHLRDGEGEPLWYMMRGFRNPPINFETAGQLTYNGGAVVAMIIAPGRPLNTFSDPGTPPAECSKLNQNVAARNTASLNAANFLECGTATGSITSQGNSLWTNDRVIAITAAEWADAVAPAIADRLQRQVAPAMDDFRTTTALASWGQSFFPNASTFNVASPPTNNLCGNNNMREGMPPTATVASGQCDTDWSGGSASGLGALLGFGGCTSGATTLRCDFTVVLGGLASPRITATAPRIGYSFRSFDRSQVTVQVNGGAVQSASTGNYTASVSSADGSATMSFEIFFPLLSILDTVRVRMPHPTDALLADVRSAWYINNGWDRFTYYGVARPATSDPSGVCSSANFTDCLTVNGMPSPSNNKRLVLALMGRELPAQNQPSTNTADYLEAGNASADDRAYPANAVTATFNDRLAACPFNYVDHGGANVVVCN